MSRGDLSEAEWRLLEPLLPPERGRKSRPAFDNRREKAIASCLFTFVYFRSSTRGRFLHQFDLIVINGGTDEIL